MFRQWHKIEKSNFIYGRVSFQGTFCAFLHMSMTLREKATIWPKGEI